MSVCVCVCVCERERESYLLVTFFTCREHESIAKEIRKFLGSSSTSEETSHSRTKKEE